MMSIVISYIIPLLAFGVLFSVFWKQVAKKYDYRFLIALSIIIVLYDIFYGHLFSKVNYYRQVSSIQYNNNQTVSIGVEGKWVLDSMPMQENRKIIDLIKRSKSKNMNHPNILDKYWIVVKDGSNEIKWLCYETDNNGFLLKLMHPNDYQIGVYRNDALGEYIDKLRKDANI